MTVTLIAPVLVKVLRANVPMFGGPLAGDAPPVKMFVSTDKVISPELLLFGKGMPDITPPVLPSVINAMVPGDQLAPPPTPAPDTLSDGAVSGQLRDGIIKILIVKVIEPEA